MVCVWNYKMGQTIGWTGDSRNFKFDLDVDAVGFLRQGLAWGGWGVLGIEMEVVM